MSIALKPSYSETLQYDAKLEGLCELWESLAGRRGLPRKSAFTPRLLKDWVANVAILEASGVPARFKVRLMGSNCAGIAGSDNTGKWIDECVGPTDVHQLLSGYMQCLIQGVPVFSHVNYVRAQISRTRVSRLYLPCCNDDGVPNTIIAAIYSMTELGSFHEDFDESTIELI